MDTRYHKAQWGANGTRVLTSPANWKKPLKWDRWAADGVCPKCGGKGHVKANPPPITFSKYKPCDRCSGEGKVEPYRAKIFCASLADVFEDWGTKPILTHQGHVAVTDTGAQMCLDDVRDRLFNLIDQTPNCDWLLLTKRPENIRLMWPAVIVSSQQQADDRNERGELYRRNVWIGCSIAEQKDADRNVPLLLKCRDLSPALWLSAEPMLGHLDMGQAWRAALKSQGWNYLQGDVDLNECPNCVAGENQSDNGYNCSKCMGTCIVPGIDWIISGVESNGHAVGRLGEFTTESDWIAAAEALGYQCRDAGVAYFVKQVPTNGRCSHDPAEWPEALRIQEFPEVMV